MSHVTIHARIVRIARLPALALVAAAAALAPANAQTNYPTRPVTLMVPYGAGGVADTAMRILAEKLSGHLKQQFVIENRPGAGGSIAARAGAAAPPDGYLISMTGNHNTIGVSLFKSQPYNIVKDFASVSTAAFFDLLIVTRADGPLKSVQDLVKAAKANPGKLNIATLSPGSTQNLGAELFKSVSGIQAVVVPFRTSSDMATAVLRGDVDVAFEFFAASQGLIGDKKLVALASTGPKRSAYLPEVPTVAESGFPDYEVLSWNGISVPAATPKEIIQTLSRATIEVLQAPDVQERGRKLGMEMRGSTPEVLDQRIKSDIAKWAGVIEKAGIQKQD